MKLNLGPLPLLAATAVLITAPPSLADDPENSLPTRTQTIALKQGWNAVWLEVDPLDHDPDTLLADLPVDRVAHYFRPTSTVKFLVDPAEEPWNNDGWGVWRPPGRDESFLKSLHGLYAHRAYLIHATTDHTWNLEGTVRFQKPSWTANSFNIKGFSVDPANPPTFANYLSTTRGKIGSRIYRLNGNHWEKILDPATATITPGTAYWLYCDGKTNFQGPIEIKFSGIDHLGFADRNTTSELEFRNRLTTDSPLTVTASPSADTTTPLPLNTVKIDFEAKETTYPDLTTHALGTLPANGIARLDLSLKRERMQAPQQSTLLRITNGHGALCWLPVTATKPSNP